jgi:hypothetical protein
MVPGGRWRLRACVKSGASPSIADEAGAGRNSYLVLRPTSPLNSLAPRAASTSDCHAQSESGPGLAPRHAPHRLRRHLELLRANGEGPVERAQGSPRVAKVSTSLAAASLATRWRCAGEQPARQEAGGDHLLFGGVPAKVSSRAAGRGSRSDDTRRRRAADKGSDKCRPWERTDEEARDLAAQVPADRELRVRSGAPQADAHHQRARARSPVVACPARATARETACRRAP